MTFILDSTNSFVNRDYECCATTRMRSEGPFGSRCLLPVTVFDLNFSSFTYWQTTDVYSNHVCLQFFPQPSFACMATGCQNHVQPPIFFFERKL